jgi:hypothetical protein
MSFWRAKSYNAETHVFLHCPLLQAYPQSKDEINKASVEQVWVPNISVKAASTANTLMVIPVSQRPRPGSRCQCMQVSSVLNLEQQMANSERQNDRAHLLNTF